MIVALWLQLRSLILMYTVLLTAEFESWLHSIKDSTTKMRLARRLEKAERGLLGDVKLIGNNL